MTRTAAQLLMERETGITFGAVPQSLFGEPLAEASWQISGEEFLLRGEGDHYFHYRKGKGITVDRGSGADLSEESLWLNGSVYIAIASINGLLPIHASAVAHDNWVIAFTGPAGAGKSTLVAGLANHALPMFCDDTLVLDLSDPDRIMCLPGHKRLKLRPDAIGLTRAIAQEKVSASVDKFYAVPALGDVGIALPLAELIYLEVGAEPAIVPITGSERFLRMQDDHQSAHLFAGAQRFDRKAQFDHRARLARHIPMSRFVRPLDPVRFSEGVALAARYVTRRLSDP